MFKKIIAALILAVASLVYSQQPQANDLPPTQPIFATNAKLVNGVAPGYWPTAASTGLTLNVSAGTSFFGSAVRQNGAQTLTMVNGTNYVYLDSTTGALASSTSNFTTGQFPIAVVTASGGNITSILDVRTMFFTIGSGSTGNSVQYPASNTAYNFFGGSRWIVATPVEITSTGVACDGINCTITATQSYTVGQPIQFYGTWAPTCLEWDIVPVATTGSTSFTVSESNTTCTGTQTGSGGTLRDATYFIPNLFSKEPYVSGHNSIVRNLGIAGGTLQNAVTNYSTLIHPYTHAVTGLPTVDFVDYGDNDISGSCSSLATMQSLMETFYADLHADGDIIVQTGIPWYEVNSITCTTADSTLDLFNTWLAHHSKGTETLANGYSDRFADLETVVSNPTDTTCYNSDQIHLGNGCTQLVANRLNSVISTQNSSNVNHLLGQGPNYMYGFQNMTAGYGTGNWAMQTTSGFAYVNGLFSLNGGANTMRFIAHAFPCWSNTVGGGILPYSAANCNVQASQNYSLANTLALGQGGVESDATASWQFKYWYPTGVTSNPALTYDGQQWYRTDTHQPCYDSNGTAVCGWGASGSSSWSALLAPTANLSLNMAHYTTTWTFDATTGTADMFKLTDTASNTGTGIMLHLTTALGSTLIPWQADANGVGWQVDASGNLKSVGTPAGPTQWAMTYNTGHAPTVGSATTTVYAVDASGNAEVSNGGTAFSLICTQATGCGSSGGASFPSSSGFVWNTSTTAARNGTAADLASLFYVVSTGSSPSYVATLTYPPASYTPGMTVNIKPNFSNVSTTPTLNVNSLGAITIVKNGSAALVANDIVTGTIAVLKYDGTNFQLMNPQTTSGGTCGTGNIPCTNTANTFNGGVQTIVTSSPSNNGLVVQGNTGSTVIHSASVFGATSATTTVSVGQIVITIQYCGAGGQNNCKTNDTLGNSWTEIMGNGLSHDGFTAWWSKITVGGSDTFSVPANTQIQVDVFSNAGTVEASSDSGYFTPLTSVTSFTPPNITTTGNDLLYSAIGLQSYNGTVTGPTGYSYGRGSASYAINGTDQETAYKTTSTPGTQSIAWNITSWSGGDGEAVFAAITPGTGSPQTADLVVLKDHTGAQLSGIDPLGNFRGAIGSSETVTFSSTPTFSLQYRTSSITLTGNITSFTLGAGIDGQEKTLCFTQDATGSRTVTAPSNVKGFFTVGSTASKTSCQHFTYLLSASAWYADSAGVINQ